MGGPYDGANGPFEKEGHTPLYFAPDPLKRSRNGLRVWGYPGEGRSEYRHVGDGRYVYADQLTPSDGRTLAAVA